MFWPSPTFSIVGIPWCVSQLRQDTGTTTTPWMKWREDLVLLKPNHKFYPSDSLLNATAGGVSDWLFGAWLLAGFKLWCQWEDPQNRTQAEANKQGCRHHGALWVLGDHQSLSFPLYIRDSCMCSSLPFDCSHSMAGISVMLNRMPLNLSPDYVIWRWVLSSTRLNNGWYNVCGFWHFSLQAIWPCSQPSIILPHLGSWK